MECTLVMFKSDGARKDIPLVGARNVIGRMSTCEVRIPLNSVSREHCELVCDGETLRYKDLNSSNGIIHNGAKSKQGALKAGDELVIGPVVFTVMINGRPSKITPIRTILDEAEDRRAVVDAAPGPRMDAKADSHSGSKTVVDAPAVVSPKAPAVPAAKAAMELPPRPSREIGSSGDHIEALKADVDFEEFNTPARKPAAKPVIPAMPAPIGDDDDDGVMEVAEALPEPAEAAHDGEGEGFEFVGDEHGEEGDEEAPAFTFE